MKVVGTKVRQNEYGTYLSLEVKVRWWYIAWIYVWEFCRALSRVQVTFFNHKVSK